MLLQALYQYAEKKNLFETVAFQDRTVHLLLSLNPDGAPRGQGFVALTTTERTAKGTREAPGRRLLLPRYPGEKNQGRASYLADGLDIVLGLRRATGGAIPEDSTVRADVDFRKSFNDFWRWVREAAERLPEEPRLKTLLLFRERHLGVARQWVRPRADAEEPEAEALTQGGNWLALSKGNVLAFELPGGDLLYARDLAEPLWRDWADEYSRRMFAEADGLPEGASIEAERRRTLCLVTGETGVTIARHHRPEIKGVLGVAPKGTTFFSANDAGSSFGLTGGEVAPVSPRAAACYALALNHLLAGDDTTFRVGKVSFCFWADGDSPVGKFAKKGLADAQPSVVRELLASPLGGIEHRGVARAERFTSVALVAPNPGRIAVREWLRVPLGEALENLRLWFDDLDIAPAYPPGKQQADEEAAGPLSLRNLALAVVREAGELDRVSEAITELYRAALTGLPVPLARLSPILAEFRSALVKDDRKRPTYPFSQSRFALIKLILRRHARQKDRGAIVPQKQAFEEPEMTPPDPPGGGFVPGPRLTAETADPPYNLGRLLYVLSDLQRAAHRPLKPGTPKKSESAKKPTEAEAEGGLKGPGIVERYYGTASAAPATVFPVLLKLHFHHLRKLEQQNTGKAMRIAAASRRRIAEILAQLKPGDPGDSPRFPKLLTLEEQGRFALGFYQQMAATMQDRRNPRPANPDAAQAAAPE